jgi:GNAT superfamily N-acetyltransferase
MQAFPAPAPSVNSVPFNFESLPLSSARPASFAKQFKFRNGTDERDQAVNAVKRAKANQCRIYVLKNNAENFGFIAVSLSTVGADVLPMLVLDYMLVSLQYRGMVYSELGGLKIVEYLVSQVIQLADDITRIVPVRYIGLEPANDRLSKFYQRLGFNKLDRTDWLFSVVPKPSGI